MIVVDASAIIELLLRTPRATRIASRLAAPGNTIHAPHLSDLEVASALRSMEARKLLTTADATKAVDAIFDVPNGILAAALKGGDEVRLVGFGNFVVSERAASEGRNPRTGEKIDIPASKQPKFKAGKGLKDSVN